jgi:hypothetical protein
VAYDKVVGLRMCIDPGNLRDGDRLGSLFADPFDLKTRHGKSISQAVKWEFDGHELAEPVESNFHLKLPEKA